MALRVESIYRISTAGPATSERTPWIVLLNWQTRRHFLDAAIRAGEGRGEHFLYSANSTIRRSMLVEHSWSTDNDISFKGDRVLPAEPLFSRRYAALSNCNEIIATGAVVPTRCVLPNESFIRNVLFLPFSFLCNGIYSSIIWNSFCLRCCTLFTSYN